jgi:hypothetical protein
MRKGTVLVFGLALFTVIGLALPASGVSVLSKLTPGPHTLQFGGLSPTFAHSSDFAITPVTGPGAPGDPAGATALGAVVFDDVGGDGFFTIGPDTLLRATLATSSTLYGGGEARLTDVLGLGAIDTGTELTFAFGNLRETTTLVHPGGAAVDSPLAVGAVTILDALRGGVAAGVGSELSDSNADGFIKFGSTFDLDGSYGDYNQDGVDDADGAGDRDRPFLAIWESNANTYTPNQTPVTDNDADGIRVDDLWVGDPWTGALGSPVDIVADGNLVAEADPGLTDDSYGKLLALFAFDTGPLPVGGARFGTITSLSTINPSINSRVDIVGINAGTGLPDAATLATVELIGGRLLDILEPWSNTFFTLSGQYQFDPLDGSIATAFLEFTNTPTLIGQVTVIPEPATLALVGLGVLALASRRR